MSSHTEQDKQNSKIAKETVKILKKGNENPQTNISYDYLFKVTLIGDSGTGKTSIITRFIDNVFKDDTMTTIGVDFKIVSFDLGENVFAKMQVWDTCGSERFKSITASFLKTCSAFVLVFDLTRMITFKNVENWIKIIKENTQPKYMLLIGNKSDLADQREVQNEEIMKYCEESKLNYIEISAKTDNNVESIFKEVAAELFLEIQRKKRENEQGGLSEFDIGGFKNIKIDNENKDKQDDKNENDPKKTGRCC